MKYKICVIGLGYVGLPLAAEFSKKFSVIGFDVDKKILDLRAGKDSTNELSKKNLKILKKYILHLIKKI